ncbi:MAG: hypothetical protein J6P73_00925 [Bacteroidales bacterium]|nr:hypothetical protein [Bacteroidales bacterium]
MESVDYRGPRVRLCEDGKYRWKYEMNMLTNPTIFLTVFKIFFYIILVGFVVFGTFIYAIHGDWEGLLGMAKAMLIAMGIMFALSLLGVLVVAIMYRGKYIVLFEMDEKEIAHIQEPSQFRKAQKMGAVAAMAGGAARSYTAAGAGMLSATKNSSTSVLANVRRVKPRRWLHVIKVNQLLNKNQIYVPAEDFDFVYNFLKAHCPNAK